MASELTIAQRAVERGLLTEDQLGACLAERRTLLQDGLDLSLRDLLFDKGLLDAPRWAGLIEPQPAPAETRAETRAEAEAPAAPAEVVLGDYRVIGELGRGAMGVVYEAVQEGLDRRVALKVLPATQALQGVARERFLREAQATASLRHPGIVPIYDIASERGVHFFAMELLEGATLRDRLEQGPLPAEQAARIVQAAAEALDYAHARGVIHRDVKPDNIMLRDDGQPVLTDFGLVLRHDELGLTRAGTIVGTPLYMAPEQAAGEPLDARVDVWALAATLYELLAGVAPFHGAGDTATLTEWIQHREPPPLRRVAPQVPAALAAIVEQGLAKSRARRYASAGALAADLGRFLAGQPVEARALSGAERLLGSLRRHRRRVAGVAAALLVGAAVWVAAGALARRWQADDLLYEALRQSDRGQVDEAIARLDEAIALAPGLAEAHVQRAELLLDQGRAADGRAGLDDALAIDPHHVGALLARARLRRAAGKLDAARADLRDALDHADADDPRPLLGLGLLLAADDPPEGLRLLRRGLELARRTRSTQDPLYLESVPLAGALELSHGEPARALVELEEAVRLAPEQAALHVLLGRALAAQGQVGAAVEAYGAALRRDPQQLEARELRGEAYRALARFQDAYADLELAAAERPSARLGLGLLAFETQTGAQGFDDDAAQRHLRAAGQDSRLSPRRRAQAHVALGWLELHASRPYRTKALARFDEALALWPRSGGARLGRALVLLRWDRLDEAERELEQARSLPGAGYAAQVGLARLAVLRGQPDQARALLDAAIAAAPARATAYGDRFRLRHAAGDAEAEADRTQALALRAETELRPFDETVDPFRLAEQSGGQGFAQLERASTRGEWRQVTAGFDLATSWLDRALVYDPLSPTAAAWRATALYLNGRFSRAVKAYARARELDPGLVQADLLCVVLRRDVLRELDPVQALAAFDALAAEPMRPRVRFAWSLERARCLIELARWDEVVAALDDAEAARPQRWVTASLRARAQTLRGAPDADDAVREAARLFFAGERDERRAALFAHAGTALESRDRDLGAYHLLSRAIEADPLSEVAWRQRSRISLRGPPEMLPKGFVDAFVAAELDPAANTDRFLELEARIRRFAVLISGLDASTQAMLERSPELPAASFCRGFMDLYRHAPADAERWFGRAHELSQGRSYLSLCYRGVARMRQGDLDGAEADFDAATKVYRGGPVVEFWRACLAAERGQDQRCLAMLERVVAGGWLVAAHLTDTPELQRLAGHERIRRLLAALASD